MVNCAMVICIDFHMVLGICIWDLLIGCLKYDHYHQVSLLQITPRPDQIRFPLERRGSRIRNTQSDDSRSAIRWHLARWSLRSALIRSQAIRPDFCGLVWGQNKCWCLRKQCILRCLRPVVNCVGCSCRYFKFFEWNIDHSRSYKQHYYCLYPPW